MKLQNEQLLMQIPWYGAYYFEDYFEVKVYFIPVGKEPFIQNSSWETSLRGPQRNRAGAFRLAAKHHYGVLMDLQKELRDEKRKIKELRRKSREEAE